MTKKSAKQFSLHALISGCALSLLILGFSTGCDTESANSVSRFVEANVAGLYSNNDASRNDGDFVSLNSGAEVTQMDLRQTGDQLEGIDNNGSVYRGTIGNVIDNDVSFNIEGFTTAGNKAIISGTITVGGGEGVMNATWIEDSLFGTVYGVANGPSVVTNTPVVTNAISNDVSFRIQSDERMTPDELASYRATAQWFIEG